MKIESSQRCPLSLFVLCSFLQRQAALIVSIIYTFKP